MSLEQFEYQQNEQAEKGEDSHSMPLSVDEETSILFIAGMMAKHGRLRQISNMRSRLITKRK